MSNFQAFRQRYLVSKDQIKENYGAIYKLMATAVLDRVDNICCCQTYIYKPPFRAEFTLRPNTIFLLVTTSKMKYVSLYVCLYVNEIKSPFNPISLAAVQALFS